MEELAAEVNPRYIRRNVVDKFPVRQCRACASTQMQRPGVYGGYESTAEKDAGGTATIEKVTGADERECLE